MVSEQGSCSRSSKQAGRQQQLQNKQQGQAKPTELCVVCQSETETVTAIDSVCKHGDFEATSQH